VPPPPGFVLRHHDDVAELVIDRPEKRNAVTDAMWEALPGVLADLDADLGVKVVALTGAGTDAFSAGADINEYWERVGDPEWGDRSRRLVGEALETLRRMDKPTIAAVAGRCVGGGVGLALACDLRVADEAAVFAIPPARLGIVYPFSETRALVELVGPARAKKLLFTAAAVPAQEAHQIGLVDEVVPTEALHARARELAAEIAGLSQFSVRAAKRLVRLVLDGAVTEPEEASRLAAEALAGEDHGEGVSAFLEKRTPRFTYR
jgi:enoyl-CoA hydratase/carnithine racemase